MRKTKWELNNFTKPKAIKPTKPVVKYVLPLSGNMKNYKAECKRATKRIQSDEVNPY